jgi:hypothetical protein
MNEPMRLLRTGALLEVVCAFFLPMQGIAQVAHVRTHLANNGATFSADLSGISSTAGSTLTIRNNSWSKLNFPFVWNSNSPAPVTSATAFASLASTAGSDEAFATQVWQYVVNHTNPYCSAGSTYEFTSDPLRILYGYGFGCCDQLAVTLAWLWNGAGYQARLAMMTFHTIPEIFYGNAWHMLDPDHRVFYRNPDGSIASVDQILANPSLVANTPDGTGWSSQTMAQLYASNASSLQYVPLSASYSNPPNPLFSLLPHESMELRDVNPWPNKIVLPINDTETWLPSGSLSGVSFRRSSNFSQASTTLLDSFNNVQTAIQVDGRRALVTSTAGAGSLTVTKNSPFPILGLQLSGEFFNNDTSGSISVEASPDGVNWSAPITLPVVVGAPAAMESVDLTSLLVGANSYFIKILLNSSSPGAVGLYNMEVQMDGQMAAQMFPLLQPGQVNTFRYQDLSSSAQSRSVEIELAVPRGSRELQHLTATSLIPEDPTYSIASDYAASHLVDGNPLTLAYPGHTQIDYDINLGVLSHVKQVSIWWGYFGTSPIYLNSWNLHGRNGMHGSWILLASGGFPNAPLMDIPVDANATDLRLTANASNWIGVYEFKAYGDEITPIVAPSSVTTVSQIPESQQYSIRQNYGAANLTDGNLNTLAYPANLSVDYVVGLNALSHVSGATIRWGYFGTNPLYISSWSLYGRNGASNPWIVLTSGGFPAADSTFVPLDNYVTDVRITASSAFNWIGLYELSIHASHQLTPISVTSNIPVDPQYGYLTSDLTDGDPSTLAYPGAQEIDYELDFGSNVSVDVTNIEWGYFGTSSLYVQQWTLFGQRDGEFGWTPLAQGGFPWAAQTEVAIHRTIRRMRLRGDGPNWIGVYEFSVFGTPGQSAK